MWRILKIGALAILALILVIISVVIIFISSGAFNRWAKGKVISELQTRYKVRAELGSIDIRLLQTEVELRDLKIYDKDYPGSAPTIALSRALVNFSIIHYFSPAATLDSVELDSLRLRILEDPNKRLNLHNMFFSGNKPSKFSLFKLAIGKLTVKDGLLVYKNQPIELETSRGGLDVEMRFQRPEVSYRGKVDLHGMSVVVHGFDLTNLNSEVQFQYVDDQMRFPSITLASDELKGKVNGALTKLSQEVYQFDTDLTVDVTKIKEPPLDKYFSKGNVQVKGKFSGQKSEFHYQGRARSSLVEFERLPLRDLDAAFVFTPQAVDVSKMTGKLYDGHFQTQGRLDLKDQESRFQVTSGGVKTYPLLSGFGHKEFHVNGTGGFDGTVHWPGIQWTQIEGQGKVDYQGEFGGLGSDGGKGMTPVSYQGTVSAQFNDKEVHLSDGLVQLPKGHVNYKGLVTFKARYDLHVDVNTRQGQELLQLSALMGLAPEKTLGKYGVALAGPAEVTAHVSDLTGQLEASGTIKAQDVQVNGIPMGTLQTHFSYSGGSLQLKDIQLADYDYRLLGATSFQLASFTEESPSITFSKVAAVQVPLDRFSGILGKHVKIKGRLSGHLQITQTAPGKYQGSATIQITRLEVYGEMIQKVSARLEFHGSTISIQDIQAQVDGGTVSGNVQFDLITHDYRVDLQGRQLPLSRFKPLQERVAIQGKANFKIQGEGSLKNPGFDLTMTAPQVVMKGYTFDNLQLKATAANHELQFDLSQVFKGNKFNFRGRAGLTAPYSVQAGLDVNQLPIVPYLALAGIDTSDLSGSITGHVTIEGPLANPQEIQAGIDLTQVTFAVRGYEIQNSAPVEISYQSGTLRMAEVAFQGKETKVQVGGTLDLAAPRKINVTLTGDANLLLIKSFITVGSVSGKIQLSTTISGTLSNPRMVGSAQLTNGFFTDPKLPTPITNADGRFQFTANQVSIDQFAADTTYGRINAEGGIFLVGFKPSRWQINIYGSGLRFDYPSGVQSIIDADIDYLKSETSQLISGAVYIRSAEYTQDVTIPELVMAYTRNQIQTTSAAIGAAGSEQIVLDVDVEAYHSLRVKDNLADVTASGDLTVRGTAQHPVLMGSITVDQGTLNLENNEYHIDQGTMTFNNPRQTTPDLNFQLSTDVEDYTVTIDVHGPVDHLSVAFRSDPPLPTASIVSLLALGQTPDQILGGPGAVQRSQYPALALYGAGALLSQSLGQALENRTSRIFGFEKFSVDPFLSGNARNPGARITLGKQLTNKLTVIYSTDVTNVQQGQLVSIEYQLTDWLTAIGTRDEYGVLAIDFKLRKRF